MYYLHSKMIVPFQKSRFFRESLFTFFCKKLRFPWRWWFFQKLFHLYSPKVNKVELLFHIKFTCKQYFHHFSLWILTLLHFFVWLFFSKIENSLGRSDRSLTNNISFSNHKTSYNLFDLSQFFTSGIHFKCEARGLPFSNGGSSWQKIGKKKEWH